MEAKNRSIVQFYRSKIGGFNAHQMIENSPSSPIKYVVVRKAQLKTLEKLGQNTSSI